MSNASARISAITPDWDGMVRNMRRQGTPARVFYFEHGIAADMIDGLDMQLQISDNLNRSSPTFEWDQKAAVYQFMGHELFRAFPLHANIEVPALQGAWVNESSGPIASRDDVDRFPWPDPMSADFRELDHYERTLPKNMKVFHCQKLWEHVRDLLGFEKLCYALSEDASLVDEVFERVGNYVMKIARTLCGYSCVGAIYIADDMGFKTSTFLAPEVFRRLVVPWHKRLAVLAHEHGKFFFLHSCGQMYSLIDDYIEQVGIDGKHSFEDVVLPVTEAKKRYGNRLTLLGGVDVDFITRSTEVAIRSQTRKILEICQPGGGYFLGLGNWVSSIPIQNYLFMLDEARRF